MQNLLRNMIYLTQNGNKISTAQRCFLTWNGNKRKSCCYILSSVFFLSHTGFELMVIWNILINSVNNWINTAEIFSPFKCKIMKRHNYLKKKLLIMRATVSRNVDIVLSHIRTTIVKDRVFYSVGIKNSKIQYKIT